jgi:hypothetical protein
LVQYACWIICTLRWNQVSVILKGYSFIDRPFIKTCIWRIHGSKPYIFRWSLVYNTPVLCFSHFHLEGVGGWSEPNETNFIWKNCHILRRSQKKISTIKDFRFGTFPSISCSGSGYTFYRPPLPVAYQGPYKLVLISTKDYNCIKSSIIIIWIRHSLQASIASTHRHVHVQIVVLGSFLHYSWLILFVLHFDLPS